MTAAFPESWTSAVTLESLQLAIDTIAELTQFRVVVLNLVRGDELVVASATGFDTATSQDGEQARLADILGTVWPVASFHELVAGSVHLGSFYFLAGQPEAPAGVSSWSTDRERLDVPGAWQVDDVLTAPLWTRDGELLGVLSLDDPVDGMRPVEPTIQVLGRWVEYANRVVLEAVEREQLARRSRLMAQTRRALSALTASPAEPADLLAATREKLLAAFGADRVGIRTYADPVTGTPSRFTARQGHPGGQEPVMEAGEALGRRAWQQGRAPIFVAGHDEANAREGFSPELQAWLAGRGHVGLLLAPIGAGDDAIGAIYLTRQSKHAPWTDVERQESLELGRDMGRILRSARAYHREQQLAAELRRLDDYRSKLIASVSRELARPLAAITENAARLAPGHVDERAVDVIAGAAEQMGRAVDDLLLLSRIADPDQRIDRDRIDVVRIVEQALTATRSKAEGVKLVVDSTGPVVIAGWPEAIARTVRALLDLAVGSTPSGGRVTVTVRDAPEGVELVVADNGVGIAPERRPRLFDEFFHVPQADRVSAPDTGLGLAIAERTVEHHGGTLVVESTPGVGTTVRVALPVGSE